MLPTTDDFMAINIFAHVKNVIRFFTNVDWRDSNGKYG
jgi:hypothetical protein